MGQPLPQIPNFHQKIDEGRHRLVNEREYLGLDSRHSQAYDRATAPPHGSAPLHDILASIPRSQNRTSRRKWQQLLRVLRSTVLAIPGGRGLFCCP
jgi:hypothetical protein